MTVNYRRKNSTKHLSPRDLFWLLGCTCTCIGLSLSSKTPQRVKFMVSSCLWLCDINVEKTNGYTLYISFELFKIFFFLPLLKKKNGKGDLVANKALLEDTLIAHFIGFSLTSAEISYIQLYLRYNLYVCFCFVFFSFTKYSVLQYSFMHVFSQVTQ